MSSGKSGRRRPLTRLEHVIMDWVWEHPSCTADAVRTGVAGQRPLKDSTIRTILRNLEDKGYVRHNVDGRTYVYRAVQTPRSVAVHTAQQLIERFCGGSVEDFLVGLVDNRILEAKELKRLAGKIASRKGKKS
jgi:predicted transcriptional regulator